MSNLTTPVPAVEPAQSLASDTGSIDALFAKITRRLIPLLFVCYVVALIDRSNVAIAQIQMKTTLGFSDAVYGTGVAMFFLSYLLFEVPSNFLMTRIGARRTLALLMVCWGVLSSCTMFVSTPMEFYASRFLLGVFEAGFYPGVLFYLMRWYPATRRAAAFALFSSAMGVSSVIGGLMSGWIVKAMDGVAGLHGWQWLFPLEGMPSAALGLLLLVWLDERARDARWLDEAEKRLLADAMQADARDSQDRHSFLQALRQPRLYGLALVYFTMIGAIAILSFWIPTIIKSVGLTDIANISMLSALPALAATFSMILLAAHAQRSREYRWHLALAMFVGTVALALLPAVPDKLVISMLLLSVASGAVFSTVPVFWGLASAKFRDEAAAGSIAVISCLGLIASLLSPTVTGWLKTVTGTMSAGLYVHAGVLALGGVVALVSTARDARPA